MRKRKRGKRGPIYQKLDHDLIRALGVVKKPTLDYSWRRGADINDIPSLVGAITTGACTTQSMMNPMTLAKESPEVRAAIVAKSKRIAIAYNKGAYQYVTDETDPTGLGSRSRR